VDTGACQHTLTGHSTSIDRIAYSPDGTQIVSVSYDKTVRLWDVKTGMCSNIFIDQEVVIRVAFSPRGNQVASSNYRKTVRLWDTESGGCRHTLVGHEQHVFALAYSPRGNLLVSWSDYGEAMLWDVETGDCCWSIGYDMPNADYLNSMSSDKAFWIASDVDRFITGDIGGTVTMWEVLREGDQYRVRVPWESTLGRLAVEGACVQDVQGLSDFNRRLLKQRGAIGEPNLRLREASKKVMRMASVVSKLGLSSSDRGVAN
jgi:WD40 repeat protein